MRAGVAAILVGAVVLAALHVVGPGADVSVLRRTISEYQLTDVAWVFNAAVLLIAAGAALVLHQARRATRITQTASARIRAATVLAVLAVAGLVAVVAFTKQDWSQARNLAGSLHRAGSLIAFISLPFAALTLAAPTVRRSPRETRTRSWAIATTAFALAGLAHFLPLLAAIAMHGAWWMGVPLGLIERGMAVCEFAALLCLAGWSTATHPRAEQPADT